MNHLIGVYSLIKRKELSTTASLVLLSLVKVWVIFTTTCIRAIIKGALNWKSVGIPSVHEILVKNATATEPKEFQHHPIASPSCL